MPARKLKDHPAYGDLSLHQSKTVPSQCATSGPLTRRIWSRPISFSRIIKTKPMKSFLILINDGFTKREWSGTTYFCLSWGIIRLMKHRVSWFWGVWRTPPSSAPDKWSVSPFSFHGPLGSQRCSQSSEHWSKKYRFWLSSWRDITIRGCLLIVLKLTWTFHLLPLPDVPGQSRTLKLIHPLHCNALVIRGNHVQRKPGDSLSSIRSILQSSLLAFPGSKMAKRRNLMCVPFVPHIEEHNQKSRRLCTWEEIKQAQP